MSEHGTPFPGWYITFQQAALAALPRPPQIDQDTALGWAGNGESFSRILAEAILPKQENEPSAKATFLAVPADDEWFELEVNNDIDPMEVVRSVGYDPKGWEYVGPRLRGNQEYRAKLVRLGYVRSLQEAREKADKMGYRLIEGQARKPFKKKFPKPDDKGHAVFGGSEWRNPLGNADVTYLSGLEGEWGSGFIWSENDFDERWRWAVVRKASSCNLVSLSF